jgi:heme oxygenase
MSLKEITKDLHTEAERSLFAKKLIAGTLSKEEYANYLWQMVLVYNGIETAGTSQGMFKNLPDIERTNKIYQDCIELVGKNHQLKWLPSVIDYYKYLLDLNQNPEKRHLVKAHLYCRHMGDLFGGQIIAKRVPGSGKFYQFKDVEALKQSIRSELTDDLGPEARVAFEWAIKIMKELSEPVLE